MVGRSPTYDLLSRGRAAAKAGDRREAKRYLERALNLFPPEDERLEALYWLSEVSDDPKVQRECLEEILASNLGDARARRKLAILDGKLKPEEIVDPDHIPAPVGGDLVGRAHAFTCPKCGGQMVYAPDGRTLVCEYCEAQEQIKARHESIEGDDFIVALATAKAQRKPISSRSVDCRGCGATFLLSPQAITHRCPYCGSAYALEQVEVRELDAPDGIIPFTISENRARAALRIWFHENPFDRQPRVARGIGVYLPAWLFDVGGQVNWTGSVYRNKQLVPLSGSRVVGEYNVLVPASRRLCAELRDVFGQFDLSVIQPFDVRYLASWMAENFSVTAADAALDARRIVQEKLRREIQANDELNQSIQDFSLRTANMLVESYRLVLLPVWLTSYTLVEGGPRYDVLINGQTAEVLGLKPRKGFSALIKEVQSFSKATSKVMLEMLTRPPGEKYDQEDQQSGDQPTQ
jgi:predicted RNA-binding Zn-ribbon protein involved in translation (DUF1610 family)